MKVDDHSVFRKEVHLPIIEKLLRNWRTTPVANQAARREAKAVLFAELAESTRQGVPLEIALCLCSQNVKEARSSLGRDFPRGADTRNGALSFIGALAFLMMAPIAYLIYAALGSRYIDSERVARIFAMRLHPLVSAGMAMSEAMRSCGFDFDRQEVEIMRAGERWGTVPKAMQTLADFQLRERELSHYSGQAVYPLYIIMILSLPIGFLYWRVKPRFDDIFFQLDISNTFHQPIFMFMAVSLQVLSFLAFPLLVIGLFLVIRSMMNGSMLSRILLLFPIFAAWMVLLIPAMQIGYDSLPSALTNSGPIIITLAISMSILWVAFAVMASLSIMRPIEGLILGIEEATSKALRFVFLIGSAQRAQLESRWMGSLSLALDSGVCEADALRTAGAICGGRLSKRSHLAAQLVETGTSIGFACREANVLPERLSNRLILLDGMSNYIVNIRQLADDVQRRAYHTLARTARVSEVMGVVLMGLICLIVVLSFYLPIFAIPTAVPYQ
ncbi:type II secretion system F family protein [bacterium]|nr:type II secretion system F family protein [bacterium]